MTPHPSTTYDATVRKQAAHVRSLYGLGHARALVSTYATKAKVTIDRDFWTDVLDALDNPTPLPPVPPTPAPEGPTDG